MIKMQVLTGVTSVCINDVTYTPDKNGLVEVAEEHAPKLLDFGFLPVDASVILEVPPTQEDIDQMHKAAQALLFIESWNKDNPHEPIGPDAAELKAEYEKNNPAQELPKVEVTTEPIKAGD